MKKLSSSEPLTDRLERYRQFDAVSEPYLRWQLEQFEPHLGRRILEVGCGVGGIAELLLERAELVWGIDVEDEVIGYAARRFAEHPECRFFAADVAALSPDQRAELREKRFDSVVAINVLEHVRDDLGALQALGEVLEPNGILALLVPAHLALYGAYDRMDGHYRRYSKSYLRVILQHTPFEALRMRYFNAVGALGWWVRYRLLGHSILGGEQYGVMNRVVPVMRALESRIPPPFGLSLAVTCRRRPDA